MKILGDYKTSGCSVKSSWLPRPPVYIVASKEKSYVKTNITSGLIDHDVLNDSTCTTFCISMCNKKGDIAYFNLENRS